MYSAIPSTLPGFENITRYWDTKNNIYAAKIIQGEFYVSMNDELITTVLGSCVSACIRDKKLGIGGMNHFMPMTPYQENLLSEIFFHIWRI